MDRLEIYEEGRKYYTNGLCTMNIGGSDKGELLTVYNGEDEVSRFCWSEQYESLKDGERELIQSVYPNIETRVSSKTKSPKDLLARIYGWCLSKENLRKPCPRCGGSGEYSYNHRDGTKCWGCNGKKYTLPRITKAFIKLVINEVEKEREVAKK